MGEQEKYDLDPTLESAMRDHLKKYVEKYKKLSDRDKGGLDLLECRMDNKDPASNRIIDRDLLAGYLSLKVAKSNNTLQKVVAFFAGVSTLSVLIQVAELLKTIH